MKARARGGEGGGGGGGGGEKRNSISIDRWKALRGG